MHSPQTLFLAPLVICVACGSQPPTYAPDSGALPPSGSASRADASAIDASVIDASAIDASAIDTVGPDAGLLREDAGVSDAAWLELGGPEMDTVRLDGPDDVDTFLVTLRAGGRVAVRIRGLSPEGPIPQVEVSDPVRRAIPTRPAGRRCAGVPLGRTREYLFVPDHDGAYTVRVALPAGSSVEAAPYAIAIEDASASGPLPLPTHATWAAATHWPVHSVVSELPHCENCGSDGAEFVDLDRDGWPDLMGAWESGHAITVHRHPGSEAARDAPWLMQTIVHSDAHAFEDVRGRDIDGDGHLDAVMASVTPGGGIRVAFGDGTFEAEWPTVWLDRSTHRWLRTLVVDIDGDGDLDVIGAPQTRFVELWTNPGGAAARDETAWERTLVAMARHVMSIYPEDVNEDGLLDLVITQRFGGPETEWTGLWWAEAGTSGGPRGTWTPHRIGPASGTSEPLITCQGDLDADGDMDYLAPFRRAPRLVWFERGSEPDSWTEHPIALPAELQGSTFIKGCSIADMDGDGDPDIVMTAHRNHNTVWLGERQPGTWVWRALTPRDWGSKTDGVEICDVDRDGDLDVMFSEENRRIGIVWLEQPG